MIRGYLAFCEYLSVVFGSSVIPQYLWSALIESLERATLTRTTCLPLTGGDTPLSNRYGLSSCRVASPPAPASRTVVVGYTSAVQAGFNGCWHSWLLSGLGRKVRLSVAGERVTPVNVRCFRSGQPNLRLIAIVRSTANCFVAETHCHSNYDISIAYVRWFSASENP